MEQHRNNDDRIPPPYEWATDRRARIHSMQQLRERGINIIIGEVHCKNCDMTYQEEYDLAQKLGEVTLFISSRITTMHDRAPQEWEKPRSPACRFCQTADVKPVISEENDSINWLFLFLGQNLGHLNAAQLKYFLKHTDIHRTGAKNRLLYLTYLGLYQQLLPDFVPN
ncbi:hypothetical protein Droror1_Dr00016653 [Drosera rotundifolia]